MLDYFKLKKIVKTKIKNMDNLFFKYIYAFYK